jgi:hypothetical protein
MADLARLIKTAAAYMPVALIAADIDLLACSDALAMLIDADIHGGFFAAGANISQFFNIVCQRQ